MIQDTATGALVPFSFENVLKYIPLLKNFPADIDSVSFDPPVDSSDITPEHWVRLAKLIEERYDSHDSFVILHGSDTMAYTASALSFMLENLSKPVILTGSQLPIGLIRTDGRENLLAALEMAVYREDGKPVIQEVCIYFENKLFRGNRTHKFSAEDFHAFDSVNYPPLAEVGVHVKFNPEHGMPLSTGKLQIQTALDTRIAILKLFPGILPDTLRPLLENDSVQAVILETYGSGNASTHPEFLGILEKAVKSGKIIYNVTQCRGGAVDPDKYQTGRALRDIGVIPGFDITPEAAVTKLMFVLARTQELQERKKLLITSLRGEMTV